MAEHHVSSPAPSYASVMHASAKIPEAGDECIVMLSDDKEITFFSWDPVVVLPVTIPTAYLDVVVPPPATIPPLSPPWHVAVVFTQLNSVLSL